MRPDIVPPLNAEDASIIDRWSNMLDDRKREKFSSMSVNCEDLRRILNLLYAPRAATFASENHLQDEVEEILKTEVDDLLGSDYFGGTI